MITIGRAFVALLVPIALTSTTVATPATDPTAGIARTSQARIGVRGPHLVALSVPDLEASARWYRHLFGLSVLQDVRPDSAMRLQVMTGPGMTVELIEDKRARPGAGRDAAAKVLVHGIFKVGIFVTNLDSTLAILRSRGVPILGHWPQSTPPNLLIQDPAGNLLQFSELSRP